MKIYQIIVFFISVSIYSQCGIVEYGVIKKEINQSSTEHTVNSYIDEINNAGVYLLILFLIKTRAIFLKKILRKLRNYQWEKN